MGKVSVVSAVNESITAKKKIFKMEEASALKKDLAELRIAFLDVNRKFKAAEERHLAEKKEMQNQVDMAMSMARNSEGKKRKRVSESVTEINPIVQLENRFEGMDEDEDENEGQKEAEKARQTGTIPKTKREILLKPTLKEKEWSERVVQSAPKKKTMTYQDIVEEAVAPKVTLKGRIRVREMEAKKVLEALEKENIKVKLTQNKEREKVWSEEGGMRTNTATITTIQCGAEERLKIVDILRENNQRGHSYMAKEERMVVKMLKNINKSFNVEDVEKWIKEEIGTMPTKVGLFKVERFKTFFSEKNQIRLPYLVVKAEDVATMQAIMSIQCICYTKPRWEDMQRTEITQCFNCYEFGHSTRGGCLNERVCKRCGKRGEHECMVEKLPEVNEKGERQNEYKNYTCCGCGGKGHPPTWSGCEKYKAKLQIVRDNRSRKEMGRMEKLNINDNRGYPNYKEAPRPVLNVWKERINRREEEETVREKTNGKGFASLKDGIKQVLGMDASEIQRIAAEFVEDYKKLSNKNDKKEALGIYFLQINKWQP